MDYQKLKHLQNMIHYEAEHTAYTGHSVPPGQIWFTNKSFQRRGHWFDEGQNSKDILMNMVSDNTPEDADELFGESRLWSCEASVYLDADDEWKQAPEGNNWLCWPTHRNYDPPGVPPDHPQPAWRGSQQLTPKSLKFNTGGSVGKHSGMVETPDDLGEYCCFTWSNGCVLDCEASGEECIVSGTIGCDGCREDGGRHSSVTLTAFSAHSGMVETPDGVFYYRRN